MKLTRVQVRSEAARKAWRSRKMRAKVRRFSGSTRDEAAWTRIWTKPIDDKFREPIG